MNAWRLSLFSPAPGFYDGMLIILPHLGLLGAPPFHERVLRLQL
jgi:hypothetical protein